MGRASTQIVIFLVLLTGASNAIMLSGVGTALDINPSVEIGGEREGAVEDDLERMHATQGTSATLYTLYTTVTDGFESFFKFVFAAPIMFRYLGLPSWLTTMIFGPLFVIVAVDAAHLLTGREM